MIALAVWNGPLLQLTYDLSCTSSFHHKKHIKQILWSLAVTAIHQSVLNGMAFHLVTVLAIAYD